MPVCDGCGSGPPRPRKACRHKSRIRRADGTAADHGGSGFDVSKPRPSRAVGLPLGPAHSRGTRQLSPLWALDEGMSSVFFA